MAAPSGSHAAPKTPPKQEDKAVLLRVESVDASATAEVGPLKPPLIPAPPPALASMGIAEPAPPAFSKLRLELRDLWALQRAAQQAGGSLTINIQTTGSITVDDLLVPLAQSRDLSVRKEGDIYVVSSSILSVDNPLRDEINRLTERRNALLQQIKFLENRR